MNQQGYVPGTCQQMGQTQKGETYVRHINDSGYADLAQLVCWSAAGKINSTCLISQSFVWNICNMSDFDG